MRSRRDVTEHPFSRALDDHLGRTPSRPERRECAPAVPCLMLERPPSGGSACRRANAAKAGGNAAALTGGRAAGCGACTVTAMAIAGYRGCARTAGAASGQPPGSRPGRQGITASSGGKRANPPAAAMPPAAFPSPRRSRGRGKTCPGPLRSLACQSTVAGFADRGCGRTSSWAGAGRCCLRPCRPIAASARDVADLTAPRLTRIASAVPASDMPG